MSSNISWLSLLVARCSKYTGKGGDDDAGSDGDDDLYIIGAVTKNDHFAQLTQIQ